jgi:prepilin peptidase CpaA
MHLTNILDSANARILVELFYAATLCYGCMSDIRSFKIPNFVSIIVLVLFFLNYFLLTSVGGLTGHLLIAGCTLSLGFALYAAGFVGAGDVKLIGALMLWAGPQHGLDFLLLMTFIGGIFAALLLIAQRSIAAWPSVARYIPSSRLKSWAKAGKFPYGIAICGAGLILMPSFFA